VDSLSDKDKVLLERICRRLLSLWNETTLSLGTKQPCLVSVMKQLSNDLASQNTILEAYRLVKHLFLQCNLKDLVLQLTQNEAFYR